ncbi:hypothetical protein Efla_007805 [Eimeria flavescens]
MGHTKQLTSEARATQTRAVAPLRPTSVLAPVQLTYRASAPHKRVIQNVFLVGHLGICVVDVPSYVRLVELERGCESPEVEVMRLSLGALRGFATSSRVKCSQNVLEQGGALIGTATIARSVLKRTPAPPELERFTRCQELFGQQLDEPHLALTSLRVQRL